MSSYDTNGNAADRDTAFWHPFSDMALVRRSEFVLTRGEGVWLYDADGRRYLDGSASLWYANIGHGRREIADAVAAQMKELEAYSTFGDAANPPVLELAERLSKVAPMDGAKIFLTTGGGEAIDSAAKIARRYWAAIGHPSRQHLISRIGGYHGTNGFGTSMGGIEANRADFGTLIPHVSYVPFDSVDALEQEIQRLGADSVAAFFMEPIIGAGGVLLPPEGYIEGVAAVCEANGVLLVVDSVIVGFGRLGTWFGIERWGVEPDMITFAKGVTSGYLPVGGVVASAKVAEPFFSEPGHMLRHGATYSGHAACAAAALANMDILENEGLLARGRELEGELDSVLRSLADHPLVSDVRAGTGLLGAVDLQDPGLVAPTAGELRDRGVIARALGSGLAFSPPLIIEKPELELIGSTMRETLDAMLEKVGSPAATGGRP